MSSDNFNPSSITNHPNIRSVIDSNFKNQKRQLVLDIETTGFSPITDDRIVEIGIIELIDRQFTGNTFHVYLNPERPVGGSEFIHKLSDEFLSTKPLFIDIADELEEFLIDAELISHNVRLDMRFLDAEWHRAGRLARSGCFQVIDTSAITTPWQTILLDDLSTQFNIKLCDSTSHGALLSAEILAKIYLKLTDEAANESCDITKVYKDPLYEEVREYVIQTQNADVSDIQRKFLLDNRRSAQIVFALEKNKIVSPMGMSDKRMVLIKWRP